MLSSREKASDRSQKCKPTSGGDALASEVAKPYPDDPLTAYRDARKLFAETRRRRHAWLLLIRVPLAFPVFPNVAFA
jgi:hypothetical protein